MDRHDEVSKIKSRIEALNRELESEKSRLNAIFRNCRHEWSDIKYDPIHHPGYTIPGDPVGTMGVDWRGPSYVPAQTTKQWKRTCKCCSLTQVTARTRKQSIAGPIAGTNCEAEIPVFD